MLNSDKDSSITHWTPSQTVLTDSLKSSVRMTVLLKEHIHRHAGLKKSSE